MNIKMVRGPSTRKLYFWSKFLLKFKNEEDILLHSSKFAKLSVSLFYKLAML